MENNEKFEKWYAEVLAGTDIVKDDYSRRYLQRKIAINKNFLKIAFEAGQRSK